MAKKISNKKLFLSVVKLNPTRSTRELRLSGIACRMRISPSARSFFSPGVVSTSNLNERCYGEYCNTARDKSNNTKTPR